MAEPALDALLQRLERPAAPEPAFADDLFEYLVDEAGLRRGRVRSRAALAPGLVRQLAWVAALAAILVALLGLLILGRGGNQLFSTTAPTPSPEVVAGGRIPDVGSSLLSIGSKAPAWTGSLLDSRPFSTDDLRGRPAAILIWCSCIRGPELRYFVEAARARDDVAFVFVSVDFEGTTRTVVDEIGTDMPVVQDDQMALMSAWQLDGFPALVLLRADGTVADIQAVTFDEATLTALLDALATGRTVPEPTSRTPGPTDAQGAPLLSSVLAIGTEAPELAGQGLEGGRVSTRDLLGQPAVVLFWLPPQAAGTPSEETTPDVTLRAVDRRGIPLLLILERELEPGDALAYLAAHGSTADVIVDRTGELFARWGLVFYQSEVLLDGAGRVVRVAGPAGLSAADLDEAASGLASPRP